MPSPVRLPKHQKKRSKHGNRKTPVEIDGVIVIFDSAKEADRWFFLKLRERAKEIEHLQRQVEYKFVIGDVLVCKYKADFVYFDVVRDTWVVEDVKGAKDRITADCRIKLNLMKACKNINVEIVYDAKELRT